MRNVSTLKAAPLLKLVADLKSAATRKVAYGFESRPGHQNQALGAHC